MTIRRARWRGSPPGCRAVWPASRQASAQAPPARILVMPFENVKREGAHLLARRSVGGAAGRRSQRARRERHHARGAAAGVRAAAGAAGGDPHRRDGDPHRAARRRRPRSSSGSLQLEGDTLVVRARSIALETGRVQPDVTERGPLSELFAHVRSGRAPARAASTTSSEAGRAHAPAARRLRELHQGAAGGDARRPPSAISTRRWRAADVRPRAAGAVGRLRRAGRSRAGARGGAAGARRFALVAPRPVSRRALASASEEVRRGVRPLQGARRRAADADGPGTTSASCSCAGAARRKRASRPSTSTRRSRPIPTTPTTSSIWATRTGWTRDPQAAIYWLREAVRRNPADGDAHFVLGAALAAGGSTTEAARERELARRLSSTYEQWEKRPAGDAVPKGLERIKNDVELPHARPHRTPPDDDRADASRRAGAVLSRSRPAAVPAGKRSRGDRRAEPRAVPVAVPGGRASAGRPHPPSQRPRPRRHRRVQDLAVERRDGRGARRARRGVPPGQGPDGGARRGRRASPSIRVGRRKRCSPASTAARRDIARPELVEGQPLAAHGRRLTER